MSGSATVHCQCIAPGEPPWGNNLSTGYHFETRLRDHSAVGAMTMHSIHDQAGATPQGANLRCNRRVTIARDQMQAEASTAPAGKSQKRRAAASEAEPRSALHAAAAPADAELHLDDILAAEVRSRGMVHSFTTLSAVM